ncbi:N-acetylmuramoyl-L-alanine amidase [Roseospira goensis]|uniref:N-acetylmuramoyl-L-alanine amidase domain-containing protein n=1 Tax=Roseospira goensis TaxID=391922 RepID=A0A7W6S2Z8_9PROT|nr:N-acetylmuramoyl-L-alanine amidase [Roseospira goensis]MBB4287946.1 hypothetical protein [Roseospira goensis]
MTVVVPAWYRAPRRRVARVFLHCSASDADAPAYRDEALVATVRGWHRARGWSDIGYHLLIDRHGVIATGRDLERTPAAQRGHNTGTLAVMVHGLRAFPDAALRACAALCAAVNAAHGGAVTFHGHCEVDPRKTCPVFDYGRLLGLDPRGRMPLAPSTAPTSDRRPA